MIVTRPTSCAPCVVDAAAAPLLADEVGEAPVPVAQAQVGSSSWYEVKCTDGRRYFFNHATHETAWSMPPEVGVGGWVGGSGWVGGC